MADEDKPVEKEVEKEIEAPLSVVGELIKDLDLDKLMTFARLCETAERWEDMSDVMKQIVVKLKENETPLTEDHETLMSVAFKNVVGGLRKAYRRMELEQDPEFADLYQKYQSGVRDQVEASCKGVIDLLTDYLVDTEFVKTHNASWEEFLKEKADDADIKNVEESQREKTLQVKFKSSFDGPKIRKLESQTYYLKMLGDYWRYLSEAAPSDNSKDQASKSYQDAWLIAKSFMQPTHPTRLGLALNSSVFVQEIQQNSERAQEIAKEAFESAIQSLDTLNDASYKDSTLIMQLLRDNLTIWQQQSAKQDAGDDELADKA